MKEVKKKRGRPKQEGARRNQYRLMLSDSEAESLKILSERTGETRADILREALRTYTNLKNFQLNSEENA